MMHPRAYSGAGGLSGKRVFEDGGGGDKEHERVFLPLLTLLGQQLSARCPRSRAALSWRPQEAWRGRASENVGALHHS